MTMHKNDWSVSSSSESDDNENDVYHSKLKTDTEFYRAYQTDAYGEDWPNELLTHNLNGNTDENGSRLWQTNTNQPSTSQSQLHNQTLTYVNDHVLIPDPKTNSYTWMRVVPLALPHAKYPPFKFANQVKLNRFYFHNKHIFI